MSRFAIVLALGLLALSASWAEADVSVRGYYRSNGTYVRPHHRSDPDGDFGNNWSTRGNVNPYTGEYGTKTSPSDGYGGSGSGYRPTFAPYDPSYAGGASVAISNPYIAVSPPAPGPALPVATTRPVQRLTSQTSAQPAARRTIEEMIQILERAKTTERLKLAKEFAVEEPAVSWADLAMRIHLAEMIRARGQGCNWRAYSTLSDMMDIFTRLDSQTQKTASQ
jgi:hypothetical protein